jgi:hypothetical protein
MFLEGILLLHSVTWSLHAVITAGSNEWNPPSEQTIVNDIISYYLETSDKSCLIFRDSAKYGS